MTALFESLSLMITCEAFSLLILMYCATTALDGYPLHLDKIHYIQMATSVYKCGTTFYKPWQSTFLSLSLLPSIWLLADICFHLSRSEPLVSHIISSFTSASSITSVHQRAGPTTWFLSFQREAVECGGKQNNEDSKWRQGATWRQ